MIGNRPFNTLIIWLLFICSISAMGQNSFYEAYDEGLLHSKKEQWSEAEFHFLRAIDLKPDAGKNVKKYGMNFYPEYDPYFKLAEVYIHLSNTEKAHVFLQKAIDAKVMKKKDIKKLQDALTGLENSPSQPHVPPEAVATAKDHPELKSDDTTKTARPADMETRNQTSTEPEKQGSDSHDFTPEATCEIRIKTIPAGATVLLDTKHVGKSPLKLEVKPGNHLVNITLNGYLPVERFWDVQPAQLINETISLVPKPKPDETKRVAEATPKKSDPKTATPSNESIVQKNSSTQTDLEGKSLAKAEPELTAPETQEVSDTLPEKPKTNEQVPEGKSLKIAPQEDSQGNSLYKGIFWGILVLVLITLGAVFFFRKHSPKADQKSISSYLQSTIELGNEAIVSPGLCVGGFTMTQLLGSGGMGLTYLATKENQSREFAVKILHSHLQKDKDVKRRFVREGELGTTLHHPNIIRIFEAGQDGEIPFIAMEYLNGRTLEEELSPDKRLEVETALAYTRCVATALDYAHLKGVIHRDLKPENLMVIPDGGLKVMDFGIAKFSDMGQTSATQSFIGTPVYSAPELLTPEHIGPESDLYSLGIILYRMLSGRVPFGGSNPLEVLQRQVNDPLPPIPESIPVPHSVWQLISKLTAKQKSQRFASAEILINQIDLITRQLQTTQKA